MPERLIHLIPGEWAEKLRAHFPRMLETARHVKVIPWQDHFATEDCNPEVLDALEYLEELLKKGGLSRKEFEKKRDELLKDTKGILSRTDGVAFIGSREVSFRKNPPVIDVLFHELGHIHFQENDLIWSSAYGGGEKLFWMGLKETFPIEEKHVRRYHEYLHRCDNEDPQKFGEELAHRIVERGSFSCYPHLYVLSLMSGVLPESIQERLGHCPNLIDDLQNDGWRFIRIERDDIYLFLVNLVSGLSYQDDFCVAYARALDIIPG